MRNIQKPSLSCSQHKQDAFLQQLCERPPTLTQVRRDGKDDSAVAGVIGTEFERVVESMEHAHFVSHMKNYATACWATTHGLQKLVLQDEQPENERAKHNPDHWYEINLTNMSLFANLSLEGLEQLVPGRLFTTRMPRDISMKDCEGDNCTLQYRTFMNKCRQNNLKVILVLTETEEFRKYSGMDGLLDYYREICGLTVYNTAIPDFQIPTSGALVQTIMDLVYHLSQGENCLVHCAGGSGRTGMVVAAIIKTLGVYDPVARIRRVKSTYVETLEQEKFLRDIPKAINCRIVKQVPRLAQAIAAEHLIQVFYTRPGDLAGGSSSSSVDGLGNDQREVIMNAFRGTFDLLDADNSGTLDRDELLAWLSLCGAELDITEISEVLLSSGSLGREKFAELLCSGAASSRRGYHV